jgi:hypothetical protein
MFKFLLAILLVVTLAFNVSADVMSPDGVIKDHVGSQEFVTKRMEVVKMDSATMFVIWANYPYDKVDYNIADFQIKVGEGKTLAVIMSGKNKGDILLNPKWKTSEAWKDIEFGRTVTGDFINTKATGGERIGKASIEFEKLGGKEWKISIVIPNRYLDGMSGFASFTPALCGNSINVQGFSVPKVPGLAVLPYTIDPGFVNNNPVVPYWVGYNYGGGYYPPFSWGGWDGCDENPPPCPPTPPVPLPGSGLLLLFPLLIMLYRKS